MSRHVQAFSVIYIKLFERRTVSDYMKLAEVAQRLGVSEKTARRYVKSGELPSVFVGNAYRISEEDLAEYLQHARVRPGDSNPKGLSRSSLEPSLFNGALEDERLVYGLPWMSYLRDLSRRWEKMAAEGTFDIGSFGEFSDNLDNLIAAYEVLKRGLKDHGVEPISDPTAELLNRELLKALDVSETVAKAAARMSQDSELATRARERQARQRSALQGLAEGEVSASA
jgi:excisionase family DNA binding protein